MSQQNRRKTNINWKIEIQPIIADAHTSKVLFYSTKSSVLEGHEQRSKQVFGRKRTRSKQAATTLKAAAPFAKGRGQIEKKRRCKQNKTKRNVAIRLVTEGRLACMQHTQKDDKRWRRYLFKVMRLECVERIQQYAFYIRYNIQRSKSTQRPKLVRSLRDGSL